MFEEEEEIVDGWVEAEIERELAGLSHLTLQDLEEEGEEKEGEGGGGCYGDKGVSAKHNIV